MNKWYGDTIQISVDESADDGLSMDYVLGLIRSVISVIEQTKFWDSISNNYFSNFNGASWLFIAGGKHDNKSIISFIIYDNVLPIGVHLSNKKITIPHSDLISIGMFVATTNFHVLGITNKINDIYALKPLALWSLMEKVKANHVYMMVNKCEFGFSSEKYKKSCIDLEYLKL